MTFHFSPDSMKHPGFLLLALLISTHGFADVVAELDAECERQREEKIAPLRQAEIEKCLTQRNKRDYCERYWADYGEGHRAINGNWIPRMFNDLPVCQEAIRERNRSRRHQRRQTR